MNQLRKCEFGIESSTSCGREEGEVKIRDARRREEVVDKENEF